MSTSTSSQSIYSPAPDHVPPALVYDYDFIFDPRLNADPQQRLQSLHREAPPLFYAPHYGGHWVVTSKKMLQEISLNHEDFSAANLMLPPGESVAVLIPATFDPPQHTAYRMPLNKHFSPNAVSAHEELIRTTAIEVIDAVIGKPRCDFLFDVVEPFPPKIFFKILGIPLDRLREFRELAQSFMSSAEAGARENAYARIGEIVGETVRQRMAEPQDDLISVLATLDFGGRKLAMAEIVNYAVLLFLGGLDTVVNGLCFAIRFLARDQALQAELRANPEKIPAAVEELLRMHSIATPLRTATRDMTFHGVTIRKGDQIMLLIAAINYDPEAFADAEKFCPHRSEHHVAFNMGAHRCIGANLGRLELKIFLQEWLRRIPRFRLDPEHPPTFAGGFSITVRSLPLLLD
jgi:cytochrome P450